MDWSWAQSFGAVVLGGVVAAWSGRLSSHRDSRTDALAAVAALEAIQSDIFGINETDAAHGILLESRTALLRGGVSWTYVEVAHRLSVAIRRTNHILRQASGDGGARGDYARKMRHPSRFHSRPLILCADVVRQVMAEAVERPLRSRLLSPIRAIQIRRLLRSVRVNHELTRLPPRTDELADLEIPWEDITPYLQWPRRRLLTLGSETAVLPTETFWPSRPPSLDDS